MGRSRRAVTEQSGRTTMPRRAHPLLRAVPLFGPLIAFSSLMAFMFYGAWWASWIGAAFVLSAAVALRGREQVRWQSAHPRFMFVIFLVFGTTLLFGWIAILHYFASWLSAFACLVLTAAAAAGLVAASWRQQRKDWRRFQKEARRQRRPGGPDRLQSRRAARIPLTRQSGPDT